MSSNFRKVYLSIFLVMLVLAGAISLSAQQEGVKNTVITSQNLEMQGTADKNFFYFSGDVEVRGTNLEINCEELTVVSLREGPEGATVGSIGAIEEIIASGSVEIHQAGRSAFAGLAEVNPQSGTVVLSEQPRIVDDEVEVTGYQFVLHKGEKKFTSVPDPNAPAEEPSRSVVRLGALPDLGFDQDEESISVDDAIEESTVPDSDITEGGPDVPSP
ncbi:MAG: LptA/OstA family protein [Puniceicoccaceae bacterium]